MIVRFLVLAGFVSCPLLYAQENDKKAWEQLLQGCKKALSSLKEKEVNLHKQEQAITNFEKMISVKDKGLSSKLLEIQISNFMIKLQIQALSYCGSSGKLGEQTIKLRKDSKITFGKEKDILFKIMSPADEAIPKLQELRRRMDKAIVQAGGKIEEVALR